MYYTVTSSILLPIDYNAYTVPGHSKQVFSFILLTQFLYYMIKWYIFTHTNNERFKYNINIVLENIKNKNNEKLNFLFLFITVKVLRK